MGPAGNDELAFDRIVLQPYEAPTGAPADLGAPGDFDEFGRPGDDDLAGHVLLSPPGEVFPRLNSAIPGPITFGEFRSAGLLGRVEALRDRDEAIMEAAGRHRLFDGHAWKQLVPGDICALRLEASESLHAPIVQGIVDAIQMSSDAERARAMISPLLRLVDEDDFFVAMPYFLPDTIAHELLTSEPADTDLLLRIRLPFPRVLCFFANAVAMGELVQAVESGDTYAVHSESPERVPLESGSAELVGVIISAGADGVGLDDRVSWVWSAIAGRRRATTVAAGLWQKSAFSSVVQNVAALVTWGDWNEPVRKPDQLEGEELTREWRRSLRRGAVRRGEPRGALAGVHVLDLRESDGTAASRGEPTGRTVRTHWRRGTWRRQPLGPRDNPHYELRWVRPTIVKRGSDDPDVQVYRVGGGR